MSEIQPEQSPTQTDGRVEAMGSVWKIYYTGATLDPVEVAKALQAMGVVKAEQAVVTNVARVTPTLSN